MSADTRPPKIKRGASVELTLEKFADRGKSLARVDGYVGDDDARAQVAELTGRSADDASRARIAEAVRDRVEGVAAQPLAVAALSEVVVHARRVHECVAEAIGPSLVRLELRLPGDDTPTIVQYRQVEVPKDKVDVEISRLGLGEKLDDVNR